MSAERTSHEHDANYPLLATRFFVPQCCRSPASSRPRLMKRLEHDIAGAGNRCVSAPPGFGKSSLLSGMDP